MTFAVFKPHTMQRFFYLLLFVVLPVAAAQAQEGILSGKVTDAKTGEPLIGATITLQPSSLGGVTDFDGNFQIPVAPGTYDLVARYTGYKNYGLSGVTVSSGKAAELFIALQSSAGHALNEVVVRGALKKDNIQSLYIAQKNRASISDGIPADIIRRSPDRNTGEVLQRVSGASVQDGKFITIRGLGDRFNSALVDNAVLPSTEPNRKAFSFDIIPAGVIDQIVITKAATPDLPGDFTGGLIHIFTKGIPENNFGNLSLSLGYRAGTTGQEFKSGFRSKTDLLGFDDGSRQLPAGFPSSKQIQNGLTQSQNIQYLSQLNNDYTIRSRQALPDFSLQGSMGRAYKLKSGSRLGLTAAISYGHLEARKQDVKRQYDNYDYTDNAWQYSSRLGGFLNAGFQKGGSTLAFKAMYNRIFEDQFLYRSGTNFSGPREVQYYAFDLIQKSLFKTSLEGNHHLGGGKLDWQLGYSIITNNQPDQRKVAYSRALGSSDAFAADNTSLGRANNRLFGQLNENMLNAGAAYSRPISFLKKGSWKAGLQAYTRSRDFFNRYLGAVLNPLAGTESDVRTLPIGELYSHSLINTGAYYLSDLTTPGDNYAANVSNTAGFLMLDHALTEPLRLVWGARVERYQMRLTPGQGKEVARLWTDVLPSLNLSYALNEKNNLRASYFRSVARPEMREVAGDLLYYDYELNANFLGNYNLDRSLIDNTDLRFEYYPGGGEIFSLSLNYKHFDKTIENSFYGQNSSYEIKPANFNNAYNAGVEMELRKKLDFIGKAGIWQRLEFYLNASYVHSRVQLTGEDRVYVNGILRDYRPLTGQSPYALNVSLGYASTNGKWQAYIHYNRLGQRLFLVGQGRFGDVYESGRNLMDVQLSWKAGKHHELGFAVRDLLNAPVHFYFDQNNNQKMDGSGFQDGNIDPNKDWIQQTYRPGSVFSLRYTYRF